MKLVCYIKEGHEQLAILTNNTLYDMDALHPELPSTMSMFLNYWDDYFPLAKNINESIEEEKTSLNIGIPVGSVNLISPVPFPASCRRAIVFNGADSALTDEQNSKTSLSYHFANHHCVQGPGDVSCMPDHVEQLDFETGIALVVSSHCKNITADEADQYIGGYMIINKIISNDHFLNKDVANVLGPWLVTPDELEEFIIDNGDDATGKRLGITLKCSVNEEPLAEISLADMSQTFAEILAACAYGVDLQPGDIIGTGATTMGTYLNLSGNADNSRRWLQKDDVIKIEADGLGASITNITEDESDFSLLR